MFNGVDQTARDAAIAAQATANSAQTEATANTASLTDKLERSDINPGVGINVTVTQGSPTGLTISATGGSSGPESLAGAWRFVYVPSAGR